MKKSFQQVASIKLNPKPTFDASSKAISKFHANSFTCINKKETSTHDWPRRESFPVHEDSPIIQPTIHDSLVRSKFRESVMNHAQQVQRSKEMATASSSNTQSRKRKSPDDAVQELEALQMKRLKTIKPNIADTGKHGDNRHLSTKPIQSPITPTLSAKTMSKLNAFRFSEASSQKYQMKLSKICGDDTLKYQEKQYDERSATNSKPIIIDHSRRLVQSSGEEIARTQRIEHTDVYERPVNETESAEQDNLQPQSRYKIQDHSSRLIQAGILEMQKSQVSDAILPTQCAFDLAYGPFTQYEMKDHSSRLIEAGKEELATTAKQVGIAFLEDQANLNVTNVNSAESNDTIDDFDDLDDSIFDDLSLDGFEFKMGKPADTTGITEMDDIDDSLFEQIIADDDAKFQEAPSSAQPETKCFSSDTVSSPSKPGLMLPPRLPSSFSPPKSVSNSGDGRKRVQPKISISPFIRPQGAFLVTSPSPIPILNSTARVVTCFRLAEMFREISSPSPPSAIELFATVKASARNRESTNQSFTLADLFFPQRPPYVHGVYSKCFESELFDDDSRPFLKAGQGGRAILARAMVRPKPKSDKNLLWNPKNDFHVSENISTAMEVEVLSIYVCRWEDIEYTKGIVMPKEILTKQEEGQKLFYKPEKKRTFAPLKPGGERAVLKDVSRNVPSSPKRDGRKYAVSRTKSGD